MNRKEIEIAVLSVLSTILKCDIDENSSRANLPQWDSLKQIEVIFAIEDELNLQFPEEVLPELNSAKRIIDEAVARHAT
ncbi:MAG: acyl carrier protein [Propionivibrio sp.]